MTRIFSKNRRGGVALIFGLTALPLIGVVGLAIDLSFTIMAKARMDLAADAAALAAAKTTANAFTNGATNYIAQGQSAGLAWFNGQAGTTGGLNMGTPVLTVSQNGGVFTASLSYSGTMATNIATFFGFPTFPVQGSTSATITVGGYSDINIMMDLSSSMGIAADQTNILAFGPMTLASNPRMAQNQYCAFACHWDATNNDFYGLARQNGISLRIDLLISAVQTVASQLISQNTGSLYRLGLYSFDQTFNTIFPVSTNLSAALAAAQNVSVPLCCGSSTTQPTPNPNTVDEPDTNYPVAMTGITSTIGVSGSGANATVPRKFLFLVTDGIADYLNSDNARVIGTLSASSCATLKSNGVTILVLYTPYVPLDNFSNTLYDNRFYSQEIAQYVEPVPGANYNALVSCATAPEYFFQASDSAGIQSAMLQMLQIATATQARFIQ